MERELDFLLDDSIGVCSYGVVGIGATPPEIIKSYDAWIADGNAAGMNYLANHRNIRMAPELLLEDSKSIISLAFPYSPAEWREKSLPAIASYAYGMDYHEVIRNRLKTAVERLGELYGGDYRICVDSAPLFERLQAELSGVGRRSANGLIAVAGFGTRVFLAEILSTAQIPVIRNRRKIERNSSAPEFCINCGKCIEACPAGALKPDSNVDSRLCLSYLTIEHRGEWDEIGERAMSTRAGRTTLFGCDICQSVCPMNAPLNPSIPPTWIEEFKPRASIMSLTARQAKEMTQTDFSLLFKNSPIKRSKLNGFLRNAANLDNDKP